MFQLYFYVHLNLDIQKDINFLSDSGMAEKQERQS